MCVLSCPATRWKQRGKEAVFHPGSLCFPGHQLPRSLTIPSSSFAPLRIGLAGETLFLCQGSFLPSSNGCSFLPPFLSLSLTDIMLVYCKVNEARQLPFMGLAPDVVTGGHHMAEAGSHFHGKRPNCALPFCRSAAGMLPKASPWTTRSSPPTCRRRSSTPRSLSPPSW